jgi:hypothetical protein
MRLLGPAAFDPLAPDRAARLLLERFAAGLDHLADGDGSAAGLWLLVDDAGALRGFWLTAGESWLDEGPNAGRMPPYAKGLLDAVTEAVWWQRFRVAPVTLDAWRPILVTEWPASLADRSSTPPPGVPPEHVRGPLDLDDDHGDDGWLEPEATAEVSRPVERGGPTVDAWPGLPDARSLVSIVRGTLRRTRSVHDGRYELVHLAAPEEEGLGVASIPADWRSGIPFDDWVVSAATDAAPLPAVHELGWPLRLPGGRVGFPLSGWLDRDLGVQPDHPRDAATGVLVARDTRSPLLGQILMAMSVTAWVLFGTLGVSGGLHWISQPKVEAELATPTVAPQPAISVCSADHRRFVEQLRCEVAHLAEGREAGEGDCDQVPEDVDLQAAWCGLHDRALDGQTALSGDDWSELAAAQACFDVLGRPWQYAREGSGSTAADPERLLRDPGLKVSALVDVVDRLDDACDTYRDKLERKVAGAVLATHVGGPSDEAQALQQLAFKRVLQGLAEPVQSCLLAGRAEGARTSQRWLHVCGEQLDERPWETDKAWNALAGDAPLDRPALVDRYLAARFGEREPTEGLWACHLQLERREPAGTGLGRWDLSVPVPGSYADPGVGSQLLLDAWLLALREGSESGGPCWAEVDRMLAGYTPVHPLLGGVAREGWPSDEQRVCGQVCAARYRIGAPSGEWVTPGADLASCLDAAAPSDDVVAGNGRLDRLRLPWSASASGAWVAPRAADVCAFNLVAQGLLPGALPDDLAPPAWAGEVVSGSGIAGGREGIAARAADALASFGRNRSTATCGNAAVACLAAEMLDVLGDPRVGAHEWRDAWSRRVASIPIRSREELADRPWCRIVRPYVDEDHKLPEGDLDFPCALGVEQARRRLETTVARLATQSWQVRAP